MFTILGQYKNGDELVIARVGHAAVYTRLNSFISGGMEHCSPREFVAVSIRYGKVTVFALPTYSLLCVGPLKLRELVNGAVYEVVGATK